MNLKRKFISNLSYAFVAQIISLVVSLVVNLVLPKFMGVTEYSYWQLFIFYSQYIPFCHLGLNDGVYLRYGGIPYDEMDKSSIKSQLCIGMVYQTIFAIILCAFSYLVINDDTNRVIIVILSCIYFLIYTAYNYIGYIFQAANETAWYSKSVIIERLSFAGVMILCLVIGRADCWPYIIGYFISEIIALAFVFIKGISIILANYIGFRETVHELKLSIKAGSQIMLANIASMLILGSGRQIIDLKWGLETFGKISFSITLTNFFLNFIRQVGMVLFPMLKQIDDKNQKKVYLFCRQGLFYVLPLMFICYFPGGYILKIWLPEYLDSVRYLALILPICFFDTKMQMLSNTYFKAQRKEKILLKINLLAMFSSLLVSIFGAYVCNNLQVVAIGMVSGIAVRSILADIILSNSLNLKLNLNIIYELIIVVCFMVTAWFAPTGIGFLITLLVYFVFLLINSEGLRKWGISLKGVLCNR